MFFGAMKHFNDGMELTGDPENRESLKKRIEDFFNYKWSNDQTMAVSTEEDQMLLMQLPIEV
jgi:hypothetical protein